MCSFLLVSSMPTLYKPSASPFFQILIICSKPFTISSDSSAGLSLIVFPETRGEAELFSAIPVLAPLVTKLIVFPVMLPPELVKNSMPV